jgi:transcriptional regulator with XRE-family HTH domain
MDNQKIGERLLRFRQEKKLSQAEFAERLGVSAGAYKNYERGDREIPSSLLLALHQEFDVDPLWLITAEDDDSLRPRMHPKHDLKLLEGVGMAVEGAIAEYGKPLSSAKKWEIISFVYGYCIREGKPDQALISTLVSVGGK